MNSARHGGLDGGPVGALEVVKHGGVDGGAGGRWRSTGDWTAAPVGGGEARGCGRRRWWEVAKHGGSGRRRRCGLAKHGGGRRRRWEVARHGVWLAVRGSGGGDECGSKDSVLKWVGGKKATRANICPPNKISGRPGVIRTSRDGGTGK